MRNIHRRFQRAKVVNPAKHPDDSGNPEKVMTHYLELLQGCDLVVFTRLFGKVTSGVGKEVNFALAREMPVYELRGSRFIRRNRPVAFVTRAETLKLYQNWLREQRWRRTTTIPPTTGNCARCGKTLRASEWAVRDRGEVSHLRCVPRGLRAKRRRFKVKPRRPGLL